MSSIPRPEHPRPQLFRADWQSLNGVWHFAFDPDCIGEQDRWYIPATEHTFRAIYGRPRRGKAKTLRINVPFPWESKLSGVQRPDYKGAAWYEREFTVPAEWVGKRPFLCFGAVDWHARVWVNGLFAGENANGYLPFAIDLTPFVQPGETAVVTVRAYDVADASTMVGKQVPRWYTYSSGIWQSVWLEARGAGGHIDGVQVTPEVAQEQAVMRFDLVAGEAGSYTLEIRADDDQFPPVSQTVELQAGAQQVTVTVPVPSPDLWSPENPHLYEFSAELTGADGAPADRIESYFGMRTISRARWDDNEYEYILLNGEPVYLRGALDQAFHPDSLHAYPSDDVIRGDIQLAKDLGLNMLRCHIKINDPRYYYWADRLGLLIMYDIPSPDLDTPTMRKMMEEELPRIMARDFNSPSVFAWVLFNETWGLTQHRTRDSHDWLAGLVETARTLDPSRLIEDNSPCHYDHVESDINSWHFYVNDYPQVRKHIQQVVDETYPGSEFNYVGGGYAQSEAPLMNSEYGGIAAKSGDQDISWCFKYQTSELRRHNQICGYVYTELDDIEWEHNGFVNYDRSAKEFGYDAFVPGMTVADLNSADFVGCDAPPCQNVDADAVVEIPLFVSHWGPAAEALQVNWSLTSTDRLGNSREVESGVSAVDARRFAVSPAGPVTLTMPETPGLATLALTLTDETGSIRTINYVNFSISGPAPAPTETESGWLLPMAPEAFTATSWPRPFSGPDRFSGTGAGWVEYEVDLPDGLDAAQIQELALRLEAGARAGLAKLDWPEKTFGLNYPQTEAERKTPSDVTVSINGVEIGALHLPDDPADARGVLSHHAGVDPGAYGYLAEVQADADALQQVLATGANTLTVRFAIPADADHAGGIALYGATRGSTPVPPTIIVKTA